MAAILDHLTAIIVGASLLGALLFVQQRSGQAAVEATVHHVAQTQTFSVMETLERDTDNMRMFVGIRPQVSQSGGVTTLFTFYTLGDPDLGMDSPIVAVTYRLEDTHRTITADGQTREVYRIARYVNDGIDSDGDGSLYDYAGGSTEGVLDFTVTLTSRDGMTNVTDGPAPDGFARVGVDLVAAVAGPARVAGDQAATATTNVTQQGGTFRPLTLTIPGDPVLPPLPDANAPLPPPPFHTPS